MPLSAEHQTLQAADRKAAVFNHNNQSYADHAALVSHISASSSGIRFSFQQETQSKRSR